MRTDGQHQVWASQWGCEEWRAVRKSKAGWHKQHQPPASTNWVSENSRAFELRLLFSEFILPDKTSMGWHFPTIPLIIWLGTDVVWCLLGELPSLMLNVSLLFGDKHGWGGVDSLHLGRGIEGLGKMGCGRISLLGKWVLGCSCSVMFKKLFSETV